MLSHSQLSTLEKVDLGRFSKLILKVEFLLSSSCLVFVRERYLGLSSGDSSAHLVLSQLKLAEGHSTVLLADLSESLLIQLSVDLVKEQCQVVHIVDNITISLNLTWHEVHCFDVLVIVLNFDL